MADSNAIGFSLKIDDNQLKKLDEIDKKINQIATDSDNMAKVFTSAMTRMGTGADGLLQKLNAIQSVVNKLDLSKFSQSANVVGHGTTQVEQFAAAISKAAEAINKYNAENRKRTDVDNSKQIAQLNKEIEAMRKRTQQLEEYINKQRQANQGGGRRGGGSSSSGTNSDTKALNAYNRAMAASEALVTQRINKIAKLRQAEEMLRNASGNYATQLNRISQEIARLNRLNEGQVDSYGRVIRSQRNFVNTSQQLTKQLALLFSVSQIEGYISKLVQVRGEFELQQVALTSILQNKDQADQLFAQITELAVRSPFTIKELTTYTKSLAAYQVQYEDLYDTTKMLADVSAGLGVDMQRLILAFGQVKAANFLRGTETRQFTEAGINMLGELSKYYTELEGRIVSVQEVQDRQFKRMISFQDVEEVFKRLTSAGGMFYNMQERQAETLAGQMSNLRDQFDLMFNEIGKDNQGAINTSISAIKLLIENWEIFANMLKAAAVGWSTYTATTLIAAAANGKFAASAVAATTSTKGLVGITAKLITSMKAFATFLKTNPITIIATALASAIYFWNDHRKAVEENRKAYDPLVNSVNRTITAVDELTKKIGEQNDRIKTANDNVGQYEKGTSEYARAESNANEEREKQNRLLEELKTKYPEIYNGIIRQKDGTVDYTNALKELNGQLEQQNYLNYLARQTATGSDNGLLADASKAAEAQQKLKLATDNADNALILMMSRMREYFATNQYASQDLKKQLDEIANSSLSSGEKIYKMFNMIINEHGVNIGDLKDIAWDFVDVGREAEKASNEAKDANERLAESTSFVAEEFKKSVIDTGKVSKEEAQEILEMFLKNIGIQNKAVLDFVKQQFEVTIGVKLDLSNNVKQEMGEVEKRVNDYLDENQFNLVGRISLDENFEQYMKELQDSLNSWQKELNELESATGERVAGGTNKQRIDELKTSIEQATETLKYWGKYQTQTIGGGSSKNPELDKIKEQVAMIEKAAKAYEDYRKLYDEETAQRMVETAFEKPFDNLDLNFAMTFDAQGVIEAYRKLAQSVGGDAQEYIEGKIAEGLTDVTTEQRTKEVEEYRKQIDELFASLSNYQELEKLGLNKDLISQLFGINVSSINDVQEVFEKIKTELKKYGKEGENLIADSEKKITDAQQKELENRLKKFADYISEYSDDTKRIMYESGENIGLANLLFNEGKINSDEYVEIIRNIVRDTNDELSKINLDKFQRSSEYIQAMGDLSLYSKRQLQDLSNKLKDVIAQSSKTMSPEDMDEYYDALGRINSQMEKISENTPWENTPISKITRLIKAQQDFSNAQQTYKKHEDDKNTYENKLKLLQQQLEVYKAQQQTAKSGSAEAMVLQKNIADTQGQIGNIMQLVSGAESGMASASTTMSAISSSLGGAVGGAAGAIAVVDAIVKGVYQSINATIEMFYEIKDLAESFGANVDEGAWENMSIAASYISEMNEQVMGSWESFKSGDMIGASVKAFQAVSSVIQGFNAIHDNKREQKIRKELELLDDLEYAYEKLEKAVEDAYSLDTLKKTTENAEENLLNQRKALQNSIALENDKKKKDEDRIKEWQRQIDDINEQLDELEKEKFSKATSGILDDVLSAADEFTNAWLESFREVGDGMDGLNENFQSILEDMLKRQASMLITGAYIDRWKKELEKYINEDDLELTAGEAKNWVDAVTSSLPGLNQALEEYFKAMQDAGFDLTGEGEGDTLTGLSKSISGLSEQQADALAALCESIRFFTSDSNAVLHSIYNFLLAPPAESPLMQEMRVQTTHLSSIDSLLGSVIKNSSGKGRIMRVEIV